MSHAEHLPALLRAADRHFSEHNYAELAHTLMVAAAVAREADQAARRARRLRLIQGGVDAR